MYYKNIFSSGLKLITVPMVDTQAATILVLLPVGSRYENKNINGISHFIEHMMFKGTEKRPTNLAIAKELDALGAEYNAFTAKDLTGYWVKLDSNYLETGLEILSDMLFHSLFEQKEFDKEKGVIIEEIKMYEDNPLLYIDSFFEKILYRNQWLGQLISGSVENIKKLPYRQLMAFKKEHYQGQNMIVTVAGKVKPVSVKKMVNRFFVTTTKSKKHQNKFPKLFLKKQNRPELQVIEKDVKQIQLAMGFPAYSYFHPQLDALNLLAIILGGNMSSRLFTEVRVKRGLAYSIKSDLSPYQDIGSFVIQAGVDKNKINEAIEIILQELKKLRDDGVTKEELERAKTFFAGKLILDLADSAEVAMWYGRQEAMGLKILKPTDKIKKIKKITAQDLIKVSQEVIRLKKLNLALIGPKLKQQSVFKKLSYNLN